VYIRHVTTDVRDRLTSLGADVLADALLLLARDDDRVRATVERLVANSDESLGRYAAGLAHLRRQSRSFYTRGQSWAFSRELEDLLADLAKAEPDPRTGVTMIARFFEHDRHAFEKCDDSDGNVGDVFRGTACDLFVRYASSCEDKAFVAATMLALVADDDYGVRDRLFDRAAEFLPERTMRDMVETLWAKGTAPGDQTHRQELRLVEDLARQLKDAQLFEKARRLSWKNLNAAACHDIAEVYFLAGDAAIALDWLKRVDEADTFHARERRALEMRIHKRLGNRDAEAALAWGAFRDARSAESLESLLAVIGHDQRDRVIAESADEIARGERFDLVGLMFLTEVRRLDEAEAHVLKHVASLDGGFYDWLLPVAQTFESSGKELAAVLLYRSLLDSILRRGQTKTYPHGVKYLRKLDELALGVVDWRGFPTHAEYKSAVRAAHAQKRSFWGRYDG
jgi:tetratricopeptide (TPR) repeat protein